MKKIECREVFGVSYWKIPWKYDLCSAYEYRNTAFARINTVVKTKWYEIDRDSIVIFENYAWDGPSGPTLDTSNAMRGSLIHDALYQAIRSGDLQMKHRKTADRIFRQILKEDGMSFIRRTLWYWCVRGFGQEHARPPDPD